MKLPAEPSSPTVDLGGSRIGEGMRNAFWNSRIATPNVHGTVQWE
jgi:hypothetical protein